MAKAKTDLVIVESPAKARTIEKYLGNHYQVVASMGHLRDLPKSTMGVDIDGDFTPQYLPVKDRADVIADLKKRAKSAGTVYLATDPDREGEAISWHLKELLNLPDDKAKRVTFNEITKKVVTESIQHPREIDQDLVDAQQARRILDRIVGYKLSPLLWRKVKPGLSAGRVQSVATRIVVDRENEIRAFQPQEYWLLDALLDCGAGTFTARFYGTAEKKMDVPDEATADKIIAAVSAEPFKIASVKRGEKQRSPSPPFITSTLQQEASRRLGMTPRRTMSVAQQLYEGVDITGEGTVGLITYMRTDSLRISEEAIAAAKTFILGRYGQSYYPKTARHYKAKAGAQDAHEAIRPSNVNLTPEQIKGDLTGEQYRLYRLIWSRFLASQMANAVYDSVSAQIMAGGHEFHASASNLKFSGYTAVYEESRDDDSKEEKEGTLPPLVEGQGLTLEAYTPLQHFTQPPARYTDATLIRAMEQNGIGRPSTYAPTVSTILDREYVIKDGKYLRPTPLGEVVTGLMEERFPDIVDMKFTARMEEKLDTVEEGKTAWKDVIRGFYGGFERDLENAEKALEGVRLKVPDEVSEEKCDVCGRNMVIKSGRFGRFLACPGYPECTFTKPLVIEMPGRCPKCGGRMMKRTGVSKKTNKQYTYYACEFSTSSDPEKKCDFMTWDVPTKDDCPECGQTMFKKAGKGFKRPYCINPACSRFVPEDQRGYVKKKTTETAEEGAESAEAADAAETAAKKTAARKTTAKKSTTAKKTSTKAASTKKTATKTAAAKKTTKKAAAEDGAEKPAKKTAAKKTATTKKATAKSAAKKTAEKEEN